MAAKKALSVDRLKTALESLDWSKVKSVFDEVDGPATDAIVIAEALRRTNDLILPYPNQAESLRDTLLNELQQFLAGGQSDGLLPKPVAEVLGTLRVAEAGYRKLVECLAHTDIPNMQPTIRVAAAIKRAEDEIEHMGAEFLKQVEERDYITLQTHFKDVAGNAVSMDSALESFVGSVGMTLKMEAFKNHWLDTEGIIIVPELPSVTDEAVHQVGSTLFLAVLWQRWQTTEEQARVLGRTLRFLRDDERPSYSSIESTEIIVEEGDDRSDWIHRVALERLTDKLSQNLIEIGATAKIVTGSTRAIGATRALPPNDWISNEEVHGIWGLNQYLAYDVVSDNERPGGLRLIEWVRGYCALMLLARDTKPGALVRTRAGWQDYLARYGLAATASETLISRLTFRRSSRDMFDHPFIKLGDGRYRLFATALRALSVPIVVLSTLSQMSIQLKRKGQAFEDVTREIFEEAGIKTYAFKAKRGNEEYEYDAVIPWGDHLFVIECKNRSLPLGSRVQMRYFDLETRDNIRQVHRLIKGLKDHPDILEQNLPPGAATKTKVPILLNCFPFSAPGKIDGVYLYDYSALSRFFMSGEIKLKSVSPNRDMTEIGTGIRLWAGNKPASQDLIAQLESPSQVENVLRSLKRDSRGFPLPPNYWVYDVSILREEALVTDHANAQAK